MKSIVNFIKNHKIIVFLISIIIFALPLILIHILFKYDACNPWFEAEWTAGELLAYIAGFEALLGTIILGLITVYQTQKAQEVNEKLAQENNYLQKISVQRLLPLLKVESVCIFDSGKVSPRYSKNENIVTVSESITKHKREIQIRAYITSQTQDEPFAKEIQISLKNISESIIRQMTVDKIEFSRFRINNEVVEQTQCIGLDKYKTISGLILPNDNLDVTVTVYFNDVRYKNFWECNDDNSVGAFDMCLYLTNTSITGITYQEKIYIDKAVGFKEKIMYKAYEDDNKDINN